MMSATRLWHRNRVAHCGSVAIEYALILPVLLLFLLGIMDVGRLLWTYTTLHRSVQAAARCGAVDPVTCATATQIETYAVGQAYGLNIPLSAYTVTAPSCGIKIQGTFVFQFFIPWLSPISPFGAANQLTLNATACYPPSH